MALSWNEIRDRAIKFSKDWEGESRERAEKDTFWNEFFNVFGKNRRSIATYEKAVKKLNKKQGFIDLFWPGKLLVEHKSKGGNLDAAFEQATDYFHGIKENEIPQFVLVSDFHRFKLYDLETKEEAEFKLKDFVKHIKLFGFIAGYQKHVYKEQDPVNIKAAYLMGQLHDELEESGYTGHSLEVFLVRLLFCLFADDTGIFEQDLFKECIEIKTKEDGSDLGAWLAQFFQVLDTPEKNRMKNLDEHLNAFPYVNGKLFEEQLPITAFNSSMREILIDCSALNWGAISPAIFGSMFQSVMDPEERRELGAHYTSEKNILKVIEPLFLDDLWKKFKSVKKNRKQLQEFHKNLSSLTFLDPACGCGNFLVISYRELRLLELEIIKSLLFEHQKLRKDVAIEAGININQLAQIDVDQFFGIEYDEFPARIAEVALWLTDHQMNLLVSEEFGRYYARLPLKKSATIVHGNALDIEWKTVITPKNLDFILGNPPFYGYHLQNDEQKKDMARVFQDVKGAGVLDYVTAWYLKASEYIAGTSINVGFVSTNSISQGEQVGILWNELIDKFKINIHFGHRTFNWSNEAKGKAAVHVVIIGFSQNQHRTKWLFDYDDINGEPVAFKVKSISPYLVEGGTTLIRTRSKPICDVQKMIYGSKPVDNGHLIFTDEEKKAFLKIEPKAKKFMKPMVSAREFIHGTGRWCLWFVNVSPKELKSMPTVKERIELVKKFRLKSTKKPTQEAALFPSLFAEIRQPKKEYIVIPQHTSEKRRYIPFGFMPSNCIANNSVSFVPDTDLFMFGIISSLMHMTWVKYTCGRIKSDYRYSNTLVYNNFPWPKSISSKVKSAVMAKAQKVLDARNNHPKSSLADMYDADLMPPDLMKAHLALDKVVDRCFRPQPFPNEAKRMEVLLEMYEEYTEPILEKVKK